MIKLVEKRTFTFKTQSTFDQALRTLKEQVPDMFKEGIVVGCKECLWLGNLKAYERTHENAIEIKKMRSFQHNDLCKEIMNLDIN